MTDEQFNRADVFRTMLMQGEKISKRDLLEILLLLLNDYFDRGLID